MLQNLQTTRENMDGLLATMRNNPQYYETIQENPEQVLREFNIMEDPSEANNPLYAWIPVPSLLCSPPASVQSTCSCPTFGCNTNYTCR